MEMRCVLHPSSNNMPARTFIISRLYLLLLLLCGISLNSCEARQPQAPPPKQHPANAPDYRAKLNNYNEFLQLQGEPLSAKFNSVLSVKVVYEARGGRMYFINSPRFRFHYDFCTRVLNYSGPLEAFNADNYGGSSRREYYLANLNYYTQSGVYALEFVSDDMISSDGLARFFAAVGDAFYAKDSLRLLVSTDHLLSLDSAGKLAMAKVYSSDIYKGQHYQPLNTGTAYGTLRLLADATNDNGQVQPDDIVILKGTPANVPVCAAIITNSYQTPLSHINILCHSRNIPSAVEQNIWKDARVAALDKQLVRLIIFGDSMQIDKATASEAEAFMKGKRPKSVVTLKYNLDVKHLIDVRNFDLRDANTIGNKAAGVGELYKVAKRPRSSFSIPEGAFAIPFYFYSQHIGSPAVKAEIDALLNDPKFASDREAQHAQLKRIRKAIKAQPLDAALLAEVTEKIKNGNAGPSYRFRSSSNAEDQSGFSGAGLYDSKTGILDDPDKGVERAIKAVWASEWDEAPYDERSYYNIDHRSSMMGILCHRNFPDEKSNGVAITRNLYRKSFPGFTVNVQIGEVSVVSPPDSVTCEQFVCMNANAINPYTNAVTTDYITYSNITKGKRVLSQAEISRLHLALADIKSHFYYLPGTRTDAEYEDYALDIEFKFDRNGKLYIKQARPYR